MVECTAPKKCALEIPVERTTYTQCQKVQPAENAMGAFDSTPRTFGAYNVAVCAIVLTAQMYSNALFLQRSVHLRM
ncbi:hypothetical protein ABEB36_003597 [Hypothenemus hampei]|uniref:Uncharacterized protein n=1 Tax=Hypothenemus hampei TaxID=57062 RepID=A0ABD1FBJ4_HYPHA